MTQTRLSPTLFLTLLGLASCGGPEAVWTPESRVAPAQRAVVWGADDALRLRLPEIGAPRPGPGTSAAGTAGALTAEPPPGWETLPAEPGRFKDLSFRIAGEPDTECYLTAQGVGPLEANVARWFGQFRQEPPSMATVRALPRDHQLLGIPALLVEVEGPFTPRDGRQRDDHAMLLLAAVSGDQVAATLKFTGPRAVVAAHREAFFALAGSIRRGGAAAGPGGAQAHGSPPGDGMDPEAEAEYAARSVPEGWTRLPGTGMRIVRYRVGPGTEAYVGRMGGDPGALFDVWRGEMGHAPLDAAARSALTTVPMFGADALLLDQQGEWQGMGGTKLAGAAMMVVAVSQPEGVVFAKMVGPVGEVTPQREAFLAFCRGLERQ